MAATSPTTAMPAAAPNASLSNVPAIWGLVGTCLLLANAVVRLAPRGIEPLQRGDLTTPQWVVLAGTLGFFAYAEGYRGFHRRFSPRVVARAMHLHQAPAWVRWLAPLGCMGLIWATPRRQRASWALLTMILVLILAVRWLPYPWRGIVDLGVVVGLSLGLASIALHLARALRGSPTPVDAELPAGIVT